MKKMKTRLALLLTAILTVSMLLAGCHGSKDSAAFAVPETLDTSVYDEVLACPNEAAFTYGRMIGRSEGILVGISSGAALWAALEIAKRPEAGGKNIVVLLPDSGDRYLTSKLFAE